MNEEIEKRFVYTFLENRIRDRIIFELTSNKRRRTAILRFCHTTEDIVKPSCIYLTTTDKSLFMSEFYNLSNVKKCHVISLNNEIDGKEVSIEKAVSSCVGFGMPSIIIVSESLALIETEQSVGAARKYILRSNETIQMC